MTRLITGSALAAIMTLTAIPAMGQTELRIFTGGQQRPDVMRQILDAYQEQASGVTVEIEGIGSLSNPVVDR